MKIENTGGEGEKWGDRGDESSNDTRSKEKRGETRRDKRWQQRKK